MKKNNLYIVAMVIMICITVWSLVNTANHNSFAEKVGKENIELQTQLETEKAPYDLMEIFKNDRSSAKNEIEILKEELEFQANIILKSEMQIRCQRPVLEKTSDMNCLLEENYTQFAK